MTSRAFPPGEAPCCTGVPIDVVGLARLFREQGHQQGGVAGEGVTAGSLAMKKARG